MPDSELRDAPQVVFAVTQLCESVVVNDSPVGVSYGLGRFGKRLAQFFKRVDD